MTLKFDQPGKSDTRMVEYDQAIVRLGLEKAQAEKELEQKKRDLKQVNISYELVLNVFSKRRSELKEEEKKEIDGKASVLSEYEEEIASLKRELESLSRSKETIETNLAEKQGVLSAIDEEIERETKKVEDLEKRRLESEDKKKTADRETRFSIIALDKAKKEFSVFSEQVSSAAAVKIELEETTEKKKKELAELNEIISILQSSNKEGLDIVASFEGERKRLQEKEEALLRKENDLAIYTERLKTLYKEAGKDITMIFS